MAEIAPPERFIPLGQALAQLPLETPGDSAWPMLAAQLGTARRKPRWPYAMTAAALLAAVALWPTMPTSDSLPGSPAGSTVELNALMTESAQLERLVAAASDDGASSATTAVLTLELEDRLRALDGELGRSAGDRARQLSLWRQRVDLLRDVARLETSRHYWAAQGQNFDVALVAAY